MICHFRAQSGAKILYVGSSDPPRQNLGVTYLFAVERNRKKIKHLLCQRNASEILTQLEEDDEKLAKIRSMLLEHRKTANTFYFQTNKMKDADVSKNIHISTIMETQMDH